MSRAIRWWVRVVVIVGVAALWAGSEAQAQSTSTIQGTVTDTQGAVVPGVTVVIRNQATGLERTLQTDGAGPYQAAALPPGMYRIETHLQGFLDTAQEVELEVARTVITNFRLAVGTVAEQVTVSASSPVIETATTSVGQVITQRTVQEIPLNGRHFVDLGLLIPGSVTPPQNGFLTAPLRGQGSFAFNTAGNREDTVNFMINGINLNDPARTRSRSSRRSTPCRSSRSTTRRSAPNTAATPAPSSTSRRARAPTSCTAKRSSSSATTQLDSRNFFNRRPRRSRRSTATSSAATSAGRSSRTGRSSSGATRACASARASTSTAASCATTSARRSPTRSRAACCRYPDCQRDRRERRGALPRIGDGAGRHRSVHRATSATTSASSDACTATTRCSATSAASRPCSSTRIPGFGDTRHSHRQIMTLNETHIFGSNLVNEARFGFNRINITFDAERAAQPGGLRDQQRASPPRIGMPADHGSSASGSNFGGPAELPAGPHRHDASCFRTRVSYLRGRSRVQIRRRVPAVQ